ncbi:hypothetical protein SISSUDRAFT_27672 [Sistotremastrum suecicum HHB10207 ss-3]|uniref:Uncharacterized protein n=1 Tax=Sistotremastrum suecicum HHB10207 ss-3 TaxID=1314776 RepID=A0A166JAQ4_9AGAM|nr:hypothetical protein SISSUDRAFT_27672 [Sistotremastrum suecicum HHB10207 ss-3]
MTDVLRYLSREQRKSDILWKQERIDEACAGLNYLVKIDEKGLFRWARANLLVDTDSTRWVDAGHGKGIISVADSPDGEGKTYVRRTSFEEDGGTPSMSLAIVGALPHFDPIWIELTSRN